MSKPLSIIIPSYNMEDYLQQCLDSLLVDNIADLEILIVNDGSKDNTLSLANEYSAKYPESIHVIDKTNGNYGSCINAGLKVASGKYIKVLDADDSFERGNLSNFIEFLKHIDVDLIISDYVIINGHGDITSIHSFFIEGLVCPFDKVLDELTRKDFQMHAVTYRRGLLTEIKYKQREGISYTDQQWMFDPILNVKSIAFFPKILYRYLVGREGQTVNIAVSYKQLDQTMTVVLDMLIRYRSLESDLDRAHAIYLKTRICQKIPSIYRIALLKTNNQEILHKLVEFDERLKEYNPQIYKKMGTDKIGMISLPYVSYWRAKIRSGKNTPLLDILRRAVMRKYRI